MKQYRLPILMLAVFEAVAITLWLTKDNVFYLLNFGRVCLLDGHAAGRSTAPQKVP